MKGDKAMPLKLYAEENKVVACLMGEIDHHGAGRLREEIDGMLERMRPDTLILDFREVTFMDSSGIGLLMGRYRALGMRGKCVQVVNVNSHIAKLLRLSGVGKYIEICGIKKSAGEQEGVYDGKHK